MSDHESIECFASVRLTPPIPKCVASDKNISTKFIFQNKKLQGKDMIYIKKNHHSQLLKEIFIRYSEYDIVINLSQKKTSN